MPCLPIVIVLVDGGHDLVDDGDLGEARLPVGVDLEDVEVPDVLGLNLRLILDSPTVLSSRRSSGWKHDW